MKDNMNVSLPKVSVIIPIYNAMQYLHRTISSILSQSFQDFEIICINDNSTDNSSEVLKEFSSKDKRIKIINNVKNVGSALSRNIGIDSAEGEYIYFIDADDYIDEKYLECMIDKIEKQKCDIVLNLSVQKVLNENISPYIHQSVPDIKQEGEFLDNITVIHNLPCFIWARMYRKAYLNKYNIRFLDAKIDDVEFNTIANMYTENTFVFYGENYYYTNNSSSVMANAKSCDCLDMLHIKAYSLIFDYMKERGKFDDRIKLFRVYPFMKVDTEEKFVFYKKFFEKIENDFHNNESIYNELEKYFAYSILNTKNYGEYINNYNKVVTIGFLRHGKNKLRI